MPIGVTVPALPAGVEHIVAIDPQKSLLVFGTEAGFQELQKTVEMLDKPLRQIEVEAQFVQISNADLDALLLEFGAVQPGQPDIGRISHNTWAALTTLIARGKAKVITAPRVLAISGLPASLKSTTVTPIVMATKDEAGKLHEIFDPIQEKREALFLSTAIGVSAAPTLNADETITLLIAPWKPVQLTDANQKELLDLSNPDLIRTLSSVRDGETMVFKGLDSRLFPRSDKDKKPENVIVLVTPRILRYATDDDVKTVALKR